MDRLSLQYILKTIQENIQDFHIFCPAKTVKKYIKGLWYKQQIQVDEWYKLKPRLTIDSRGRESEQVFHFRN